MLEPLLTGGIRTAQLGDVWLAASGRGLVWLEFGVGRAEFEHALQHHMPGKALAYAARHPAIESATCQVAEYLEGKRRKFALPIDWSAMSDFQQRVLQAVMAIPYGQRRTYGEIAAQVGAPQAPRAVGRANATNPVPLIIPCHRVVGSDGKLHGYGGAGGLRTKQWLLDMEGAQKPALHT